jgi:hypothetical protein
MKYQGTIGVHATVSEDTPVFDVFFAPNMNQSECNSRRFRELQELGEFLESLEVKHEVVTRTLDEVRKGRSASIENIVLSDEVIFDEGLDSTITLNRRIN